MYRSRGFNAPPPVHMSVIVNRVRGFVDTDSAGDKFGLKGLIAHNFAPQLGSELERLFLPDLVSVTHPLTLPLPVRPYAASSGGSAASSPGSLSPWDEFRTNGRDQDLDELDRLVRGMEVTAPPEPEDDDLDTILPGLPAYPALSTSPGSDSSDSSGDSYGILSTTNTIMSKARLLEILRERERDRLARRRQKVKGDKICVFCRNNGESEAVYSTHQLKDAQGRVTCPVLYIYTCPICGASGENAHTIKYCPLNPHDKKAKNPCKSPRNSAGQKRPQVSMQGLFKFHSP